MTTITPHLPHWPQKEIAWLPRVTCPGRLEIDFRRLGLVVVFAPTLVGQGVDGPDCVSGDPPGSRLAHRGTSTCARRS